MKTGSVLLRFLTLSWLFSSLLLAPPAFALSNITIMADPEISVAVTRLARDYARTSGVAVATSFVDKDAQNEQITGNGEADVLITADWNWVQDLQTYGLLDVNYLQRFAYGKLALVGPADIPLNLNIRTEAPLSPLIQAMEMEQRLLLGSPETIYTSRFAREALQTIGWMDELEPYIRFINYPDEIRYEVRTQKSFAVVPYSEALAMAGSRVVGIFPEDSADAMNYYAVVIAGEQMGLARNFVKYLHSKTARNIINNAGLSAANPDSTAP